MTENNLSKEITDKLNLLDFGTSPAKVEKKGVYK